MIKRASSRKECREIRLLFTSEMDPELEIPVLPRKPSQFGDIGTLLGAWEDDHLVGAAFVRPAIREASAIFDHLSDRDPSLARDSSTWLSEKVVFVELIATVAQHRRKGIANDLLSEIKASSIYAGREVMIAVAGNNNSRRLFAFADYIIFRPYVSLVLTTNQNGRVRDLGTLPGVPDCNYAVKEIGRNNRFSFMITQPSCNEDFGLWKLNDKNFHASANR